MEVKTVIVYASERAKFDEEVNRLLAEGWKLRDVQTLPNTNGNFNRLVAILERRCE